MDCLVIADDGSANPMFLKRLLHRVMASSQTRDLRNALQAPADAKKSLIVEFGEVTRFQAVELAAVRQVSARACR